MFSEDFIHYLWKVKLLDLSNLKTTDGQELNILNFGNHNHNAGPDFLNAAVKIDGTTWYGNIEIHLKASDWLKHNHQSDPAYSNVILHVVFEYDQAIHRDDMSVIPTLEIKSRIHRGAMKKYFQLMANKQWIPCQELIGAIDLLRMDFWLEKLAIERILEKAKKLQRIHEMVDLDWDEAFYIILARSFGARVNMDAFEALAKSLPRKILLKHRDDLFQLEALLFGQAGLLFFDPKESYPKQLKAEYGFLRKKYNLNPIPTAIWKFMRMRPSNFPTIRIAQFAALLHRENFSLFNISDASNYKSLKNKLKAKTSDYWLDHYRFDTQSKIKIKYLGEQIVDSIIINAIVPMIFLFGHVKKIESYKLRAIDILNEMKPEINAITKGWKKLGIHGNSAFHSQALIQLKNAYCDNKECLNCQIGHFLLKKSIL